MTNMQSDSERRTALDEYRHALRSTSSPRDWFSLGLAVVAVALLAVNLRLVFGSSSAVAADIRQAYHLSATSTALLTTGPVVCLGLCGLLAPRALRRWSAPTVVVICLFVIAAGTAVRGVNSWPALLLGTLLAGAGIAVANVVGPVLIRQLFPHRIGMMTGLFTALVSASAGIAAGLTVPLAEQVFNGWRPTLLFWAGPTVVALAVFMVLMAQQRSRGGGSDGQQPRSRTTPSMPLSSRTAWALTGFMGIQSLLAYSMIAWLPTIYRDRGLSAESSGLVLTVLSLASIATALTVPILATRSTEQRVLAVVVVALSIAGLFGVLTAGPHLAVVWAVLLGLGQGGQLSLALSMVNLRSRNTTTAAGLSTMMQSIGYLIAAAGPLVIGAVHTTTDSWTTPVLLLIVLMIALLACGWIAGSPTTIGAPDSDATRPTPLRG